MEENNSKTMLIAGKYMTENFNFANGVASSARNIVVTKDWSEEEGEFTGKKPTIAERKEKQAAYEEEKAQEAMSGICNIEWNKSSPLSSRSLVLQTQCLYGGIDEAVLYFDEEWYASHANRMDSEEISRGCDEMILGYQYLAMEVVSYFQKKFSGDKKGDLVFMMKHSPSPVESLRNPALRNGLSSVASPLVAAAAAAFKSFAENLSVIFMDSTYFNVHLILTEPSADTFHRDDESGRWLCTYLDEMAEQSKNSAKKDVEWIRPGEKQNQRSFFKFFKR